MVDSARLNPKRMHNGQSAAKARIGQGSTTRAFARRAASDWRLEVVGIRKDEDIVLSLSKWQRAKASGVSDPKLYDIQALKITSIDKAKGIVAQPMPRSWHDRHAANTIEGDEIRRFYNRIVADKKPYFMIYIYPSLMKQYNTYIKNTNKNALREFRLSVDELEALPEDLLTERQAEFLRYYQSRIPVGTGPCVMNRICRRFEQEFDGYLRSRRTEVDFDYAILKSDAVYTKTQYNSVAAIREEYNRQLRSFAVYSSYERVSADDACLVVAGLRDRFIQDATLACPNEDALCNIVLDLCYTSGLTKRFAWDVCGPSIIKNLLARNENRFTYPTRSDNGPISFKGFNYELANYCVEETDGDHFE